LRRSPFLLSQARWSGSRPARAPERGAPRTARLSCC